MDLTIKYTSHPPNALSPPQNGAQENWNEYMMQNPTYAGALPHTLSVELLILSIQNDYHHNQIVCSKEASSEWSR